MGIKKLGACLVLFIVITVVGFAQTVNVARLEQDSPIQVMSAQLRNFQYTSELQISLSGFPANSVKSADFRLFIYRDGAIVAGEGWSQHSLQSEFMRDSKLHLGPKDKAVIVVQKVVTKERTYSVPEDALIEAVKSFISGKPYQPLYGTISEFRPDVGSSPAVLRRVPKFVLAQTSDWCTTTALEAAKSGCGGAGIASFSCNNQARSFSFTCRGNTPTQPPPGDK